MLLDRIFLLLIVLALAVPVFWAIPARWFVMRQYFLTAVSLAVLWLLGAYLPLIPLAFFVLVAAFFALDRAGVSPDRLRALSWLLFVPLLLNDLMRPWLGLAPSSNGAGFDMFALGFGFATLRAFLCVRSVIVQRRFDAGATLVALSFFSTYLTGPIAGSAHFAEAACAPRITAREGIHALCRIGLGAALFLVARPAAAQFDPGLDGAGALAAWQGVFARFIALYLDFSGYSEVAIGAAALFGFKIPENFRAPLLARSIQEFWQRWHMSLSRLIGTYLAKPLTRRTGRPTLAVVTAFVLVGLWHATTPNYVFWGFAHGAALALHLRLRDPIARLPVPRALVGLAGWALTIGYVATLSSIANAPSADAGLALVMRLLGTG